MVPSTYWYHLGRKVNTIANFESWTKKALGKATLELMGRLWHLPDSSSPLGMEHKDPAHSKDVSAPSAASQLDQ